MLHCYLQGHRPIIVEEEPDPIEVSSDIEMSEEEEESDISRDSYDDSDDDSDNIPGDPDAYYGGYGACYRCGKCILYTGKISPPFYFRPSFTFAL